jgi:very-short-patch-repair endonuclease
MRTQASTVEELIARLATRAHGVVTRAELLAAGVTPKEIKARVRKGALIRVHHGVYRVGHRAPSVEARYLAAVKACGEGAVLSGLAAAHLWGLVRGAVPGPEVTTRTERRVPGVKTRRARQVRRTTCRGIPITTVPQTLCDVAGSLSLDALGRACHEAWVKFRVGPEQVEPLLRNQPGAANLRAILRGDAHVTLSKLERAFLKLLREHDLPPPKTNRPAGTKIVDCRWQAHGLTVELDSYRYHASRHAFENDRVREREAYARGDDFRRYTYGDITERPATVLAELIPLVGEKSSTL